MVTEITKDNKDSFPKRHNELYEALILSYCYDHYQNIQKTDLIPYKKNMSLRYQIFCQKTLKMYTEKLSNA
jgi:hypothetical protein